MYLALPFLRFSSGKGIAMDRTRRSGHNPITEMLNRISAGQPIDRSKTTYKNAPSQIDDSSTLAAKHKKRAPVQPEPKN
ncbi:hypothetical protein [Bosea sp. Root381]|uniref:hypothetical protein n=1 Tax=Bosea sp. Root381 TaxID=1736524 RepID=UPI000AD97987|nr:hypothetical protein [Bosea sp. Root381]